MDLRLIETGDPIQIRTSDRYTFKSCRVKWLFQSPLREHVEYTPGIPALDEGVAVHAGLEAYYDPETWDWLKDERREAVHGLALEAFTEAVRQQIDRVKQNTEYTPDLRERFTVQYKRGRGMLEHYFSWAPKADAELRPVYSEIGFDVPINVPVDMVRAVERSGRFKVMNGELYFLDSSSGNTVARQVRYGGRLDVLMEYEPDGTLWVMDHKTTAQFGEMAHLELDPQCGSYLWAIRHQLGLACDGVIYNQLRKAVPKPPQVLQNGKLSKNKQQTTTLDLYRAKLKELGQTEEGYEDFLAHLEGASDGYFRRFQVPRSKRELDILHRNIILEAMDMIDDPAIYPNASQWNCRGCPFKTPCVSMQDGSDWRWHLEESGLYVSRAGKEN